VTDSAWPAEPPGPPRVEPLAPSDWPPAMRDALAALHPPVARHPFPDRSEGRPKGLNVLGTLAHHPELARGFHTFNGHVLFATTLTERQRELLVLRVAAVRGSAYEWAQHGVLAGDVGLSPDEVERIAEGPGAAGWSTLERGMVTAVDELIRDGAIGDETWAALSAELDVQQVLDLIFTVGAYDALAMALGSLRVALDDDLKRK
jgi:alkylhydroperoxidase family enzyme